MWPFFNNLIKQKYPVIVLVIGAFFAGASCITVGQKDTYFLTHTPAPLTLFVLGSILMTISVSGFIYSLLRPPSVGGLDLSAIKEHRGILSVSIYSCEIRVVKGKLEEYKYNAGSAVVLPCNEYFDDECAVDIRSALGAYVNATFKDRCNEFSLMVREQCSLAFGSGVEQDKTKNTRANSFGVGTCLLLSKPLDSRVPIALVSTTTQRAQEGLVSSVSYLFDGMKSLFTSIADARINEVVMPLLGSGHGGVDRRLALIGLLIAIAEAARCGQGGHRERKVTIIIFKKDKNTPAEVDDVVIRRGLALIGPKETNIPKPVPARVKEAA